MQKAKVDILLVTFAYGGNGGVSCIIPELGQWTTKTVIAMKGDERIGRIRPMILSDTPITMTRNRAVRIAQDEDYDMILMLDSDNEPDGYLGSSPSVKPFWDEAFNFAYDRLVKGIPTVIAAPYCGPPPHPVNKPGILDKGEVPYLFEWMDDESDTHQPLRRLEILNRNEAARLSGIYPVAALPTGVCLFTTNAFTPLNKPYFYYEFNEDNSEKESTEDVVATRNLSLHWKMERDIDVLFAACDSWALHYKPKRVGKPRVTPVETMAKQFRDALTLDPVNAFECKKHVDFTANLPTRGQVLTHDQNEIYVSDDELEEARKEIEAEAELVQKSEPVEDEQVQVDDYDTGEDSREGNPEDEGDVGDEVSHDYKSNGHALRYKMVSGKKVAVLNGDEIDDNSLEMVAKIAQWVANKKGGPISSAVARCGTGQAVAAILNSLPEGSHLHALDCVGPRESRDKVSEFLKSFADEVSTGRVMANIDGERFPWPETRSELDFIFVGDNYSPVSLRNWLDQLAIGGVLVGTGFEIDMPDIENGAQQVREFASELDLKLRHEGDVWAIINAKQ